MNKILLQSIYSLLLLINLIVSITSQIYNDKVNTTTPSPPLPEPTKPTQDDYLINKNKFLDQLTSMLYHIENTKTCGYNLQTFKNINFKEFFLKKYSYQIQKSLQLGNFLNSYLKDNYEHHENDLTDRNFINSFKYFLLSKQQQSKKPLLQNDYQNIEQEFKDDYIIGYGLLLKKPYDTQTTCIFIENNTYTNNCFEKSPITEHLNNVLDSTDDVVSRDKDNLNCANWYTNMKNSFDNEVKNKNLNSNEDLLKSLILNKNFNHTQWCGPFYECTADFTDSKRDTVRKIDNWVVLYTLPLFNNQKQLEGALLFKLNITNIDINQCDNFNDDPLFYNTHKCKNNSICLFKPKNGFKSGSYICACKSGYGNSDSVYSTYDGTHIEREYWNYKNMKTNNNYTQNFNCLKCKFNDCCNFNNNVLIPNENTIVLSNTIETWSKTGCIQRYNMILRYCLLVIQSTCILLTIVFAVLVFQYRRVKVFKHSMWILLEMKLLGAGLLYSTILIQFFEPSKYSCIIIPWFRELGFIIVYGILNLRLYKILTEFQSRKAHCVQLKDKDILRILLFLIICVIGYLAAWSLVDLEYTNEGFDLTKIIFKGGYKYRVCKIKWWDYFIEIAEFTFLCVGFYFLYCTRMAPSEYHERKFISIILYSECLVSTTIHIIMKQALWYKLHPDIAFILYFIRCHLTVSVMVAFLFVYKLYFLLQPSDDYCRSARLSTIDGVEIHSEIAKFHFNTAANNNNNVNNSENDTLDINLNELDQDEIRAELKRLYMQLHIQKLKSVKTDNPHIPSKRRNNRKNRRFSNAFQKAIGKDYESVTMKTPEESICSNDITTAHGGFLNTDDSSSPSIMNFTALNNFTHMTASSNQDTLNDRDSFSNKLNESQTSRVQFK